MKILFVWPGLTGYMGDCWRTLAKRAQVKVLVDGTGLGKNFTEDVMSGIDWTRVTEDNVIGEIRAFAPDAIIVVGWHRRVPRILAFASELAHVPKLLVMDMPWRWSLRCLAARFVLRRYVRRFRGILVHGAPSARYARWLGFADKDIHCHCICGIETRRFAGKDIRGLKPDGEGAVVTGKRTGFLFVGRKVPEKGIDVLKAAYEMYRQRGGTWTLDIPDWIDPEDVPQVMRAHACLVLPSRWEPWGVVVAEAKAAGMAVIVSDRVGARLDLPVDAVVRFGDVTGLAAAMRQIEQQGAVSADECRRAVERFGCAAWCDRVRKICERVKTARE